MTIRVLVVDDNDFVRKSVISVLDRTDGIDVVAECADGIDVAMTAGLVHPDVVVMDLQMPMMSGIDAAWLLGTSQPGVRVLILSGLLSPRSVAAAARAGAVGFLLKDGDAASLVRAIRTVASGGTAWPGSKMPLSGPLVDSVRS